MVLGRGTRCDLAGSVSVTLGFETSKAHSVDQIDVSSRPLSLQHAFLPAPHHAGYGLSHCKQALTNAFVLSCLGHGV